MLAPLHYIATRPIHDIREFADDTRWAQRPVTKIYYVDRDDGNLCSITTDGQDKRVLVSDTVKDYQFRSDLGWFLYRNGSNNLYILRAGGKPQVCWRTDQRFTMDQAACSPDGAVVAYLCKVGDMKRFELILRDVASGRVVKTGIKTHQDDYDTEIAWSDAPHIVFLKTIGKVEAFHVGDDLSVSLIPLESVDRKLLAVYGRFKNGGAWWGGDDWGPSPFSHDKSDGKEAIAYYGLESCLQVNMKNGGTFFLADNPGLLHLPSRAFNEVCFLGNGNELIFDDDRDVYLLDVAQRKVGWITHGSKLVTATRDTKGISSMGRRSTKTEIERQLDLPLFCSAGPVDD